MAAAEDPFVKHTSTDIPGLNAMQVIGKDSVDYFRLRVHNQGKQPAESSQPSVEHLAATPAELLRPEQVLALQRAVGNGAVQRTLAANTVAPPRATASADVIQRKPSPSSSLDHAASAQRHERDPRAP